MCADSFFQVVRIPMSWYGEYLTTAHVLFKNTEPKVDNDYSSNFDFILYVLSRVVFFQAHLL